MDFIAKLKWVERVSFHSAKTAADEIVFLVRHRDGQNPARTQEGMHFAENFTWVWNVFEDMPDSRHVKTFLAKSSSVICPIFTSHPLCRA